MDKLCTNCSSYFCEYLYAKIIRFLPLKWIFKKNHQFGLGKWVLEVVVDGERGKGDGDKRDDQPAVRQGMVLLHRGTIV